MARYSDEEDGGGPVDPGGGGGPAVVKPYYLKFTWTHTDQNEYALKGFKIAIFEGSDPNDTSKYITKERILGPLERSTVVTVSVSRTLTINAAIQTLYADGNESSWRLISGSVVRDPDTLPLGTAADFVAANTAATTALLPSAVGDGATAQFLVGQPKRTNLTIYSGQFDNAAWGKARAAIVASSVLGPTGVPAWRMNEDTTAGATHYVSKQVAGVQAGVDCIVYYDVLFGERDLAIFTTNRDGSTLGSYFNLSTKAVTAKAHEDAGVIDLGSGWCRCWVRTATGTGAGSFYTYNYTVPAGTSTRIYNGDGTSGLWVAEAQVEIGSVPTDYITTGASAVSDYGISCEDWRGTWKLSPVPRTNVVKYSRDFTQAAWVKRGTAAVAGNSLPSPDGNTGDGDTISGLGAIFTNDIYQSCTGVTGSRYEPSFWLYKISTSGTLRIQNTQGGSGRWDIDLAALPNGWTKMVRGHAALTIVQEFVCSGGSIGPHLVSPNGPISFGIWQMQMEPGNTATPEIATFAAGVTQTDYTVASNLATLSPAPWKGGIVRGVSSNAASVAAGAAAIIAAASLDTKITNLERPALRNLRASLAARRTSAKAKAQSMVPVVPQTALDAAWTAFVDNVDPILAAVVDTTIVKASFDGWWSAVDTAITDLQGAMARQAESTANTALAATIAAGSDGILSKGEKPGVVIDYNTAASDYGILLAKARACGVAFDDFAATFQTLAEYLKSLDPAYTDTTQDTPIDAVSWAEVWGAWGLAYTDMLVRVAGAGPSTVDGIAGVNQNLTTNAAAPVLDGVTMVANKVVMLPAQTAKAENGIYRVAYTPPAGAGYNVLPSSSATTTNYGGSVVNPTYAYDVAAGVPDDTTYATVNSGSISKSSYGSVIYSGFAGSGLTGDLTIKITPFCEQGTEFGSSTVLVSLSTDGGQSYSTVATFEAYTTLQTLTVPLVGVNGSDIRVKIRASATNDYDMNMNVIGLLTAWAQVHSIYLAIPSTGAANWSFVKQAGIPNASIWRSKAGSTYGPGMHFVASVASDGGVTLTAQDPPYEAPLGKPASGSGFLKRSSAGGTSWEARRYGFPDYASGSTRSVGTVYQAAEDGWLSLVLTGGYINEINVFVGTTNNPTNQIWKSGDDLNQNTKHAGALLPIPAGTYYKVTNGTYAYETISYRWFPALG